MRWILLLITIAVSISSWPVRSIAQEDNNSSGPAVTEAEIGQLVLQLDSPVFVERLRAVRQLEAVGLPALAAVADAAEHSSVEGQTRAFSILMSWCRTSQPELEAATLETLQHLADSTSPRCARMAHQLLNWRRDLKFSELVSFLEQLDARVTIRRAPDGSIQTTTVQVSSNWSGTDEDLDRLRELENLTWLSVESARVGNRAVQAIAACDTLEYLFLGQTRITTSGLEPLKKLKRLKHLSLRDLPIGDEALGKLGAMPQLESLGLDGTQVSDAGLQQLKNFPNLRVLWLDGSQVTDQGLVFLLSTPNLTRLFLSRTNTGGPGLEYLSELKQLNYLSLKEVQLTAEGVAQLGKVSQLQTLGLDHTNVTDDMLASLSGLSNLEVLWLSKTPVTDAAFSQLEKIGSLRTVYLHGSQVTKEAAEQFRSTHSGFNLHY